MNYTISKEQIDQVMAALSIPEHQLEGEDRAAIVLLQGLLAQPEGEPVEYLLDGMRIKLNFNTVGNMTSLQNMVHKLQGRWVCFVGAENDKHLKATHPAAFVPITADMVTDDVIESCIPQWMMSELEDVREVIAAAVNAWGAKK